MNFRLEYPCEGIMPILEPTTLETHLAVGADGTPTLTFKGLTTPGTSWSAGVASEVKTDTINQQCYGLHKLLGTDYRPAHSGVFYKVPLGTSGISDPSPTGLTTWSTFTTDDVLTEPKMPSNYLDELYPLDYSVDPLSTDPPKYKPTAWFAVFPQVLALFLLPRLFLICTSTCSTLDKFMSLLTYPPISERTLKLQHLV